MAGYSRGYSVEPRGAWAKWTCEREGCGQSGTDRGEEAADNAAWAAAMHQQEQHRELVVREAAQCLRHAQEILRALPQVLTDIDVVTHRGHACVTPESAQEALSSWAWQVLAQLPEPEPGVEDFAARSMCRHNTRPHRPALRSEPAGAGE
ncbi:hypothetical protein [Streptomyces flavidovirens]|uniref:Uncharacterized protein n=1 Tax=Streptomyces flavidovirens TaxID=67298 RepID=A0ABW6RRU2_9ACTN